MNPGKLVLVRHGLSTYNDQNRFTGWKDVPLNAQGIAEAEQAVPLLHRIKFGIAFTSALVRAQHTLDILIAGIGQDELPVERDLALNERNYGDLIGQTKLRPPRSSAPSRSTSGAAVTTLRRRAASH